MNLEAEILEWSATRPAWQRSLLAEIARGEMLQTNRYKQIAESLARGGTDWGPDLSAGDLPQQQGPATQVDLIAVTAEAHVNALHEGATLTFGKRGLTIVYGDNASGKSGYARLVKAVVRARHQEEILSNVFGDTGQQRPEAKVVYSAGDERRETSWPGPSDSALASIGFYDEACGDAYITTESEVGYRPSALSVLDGLIHACDEVREALDRMLAQNNAQRVALPALDVGSAAQAFLDGLTGATTEDQVESACSFPENGADFLLEAQQEEARLRASNPAHERERLTEQAEALFTLSSHLASLLTQLDDKATEAQERERQQAAELRAAADAVAAEASNAEALPGTGSTAWRAMWEAARTYAESEAYHEGSFPHVHLGAHCVLCQQELAEPAARRLERFEALMRDQTQTDAQAAEESVAHRLASLEHLVVVPAQIGSLLGKLEQASPVVAAQCHSVLAMLETRRLSMIAQIAHRREVEVSAVVAVEFGLSPEELVQRGDQLRTQAQAIEESGFKVVLAEAVTRRRDLEGRRALSTINVDIHREIARRKARGALDEAKRSTDTTGITRKSTELVRAHVTALIRDRFTRESDRLHLERITLEDFGGHKGQLMHRPAFLGASQRAPMARVLSEGEQTALGLAGYFTEAYLDESRSAMVLDDPVTSLDHGRRGYVARRLAEFGKDRQVIVFTHELSFVGELHAGAEHHGVAVTERYVLRAPDTTPGLCLEQHPWKAKDVKARLANLGDVLDKLRNESLQTDAESYETATSDWAGKLSETWERIVSLEIVNRVVDRGTSEVKPKMFRLLARITETDDQEFQESYARVSRWARRHDKSPDTNYVLPSVEELFEEFDLVTRWFRRIRKYQD